MEGRGGRFEAHSSVNVKMHHLETVLVKTTILDSLSQDTKISHNTQTHNTHKADTHEGQRVNVWKKCLGNLVASLRISSITVAMLAISGADLESMTTDFRNNDCLPEWSRAMLP